MKNVIIGFIVAAAPFAVLPAIAQESGDSGTVTHTRSYESGTRIRPGSGSDTSSALYKSGVGAKGANGFAPKYRERINTYTEQIALGVSKGWLSPENAEHFKSELARLSSLETEASAHQYAQPYLDNVEKAFTQYNIDFTKATNAPAVVGAGSPKGPGAPVGSGASKTAAAGHKTKAGAKSAHGVKVHTKTDTKVKTTTVKTTTKKD